MPYIVLTVNPRGEVRVVQTTRPEVPDGFVAPGEVAFVVEPLAIKARHDHEVQTLDGTADEKEEKGSDTKTQADILRYFVYSHLSDVKLREVSRYFCDLAYKMDAMLPNGPEKSTALRKLLEGKDAAVRAALDQL